MEKLKRRRFGKTELMITEVSFGAMNLRRLETLPQTEEIVNYVLDQGVNLIDTARAYNGQLPGGEPVESEVIVGKVIRARQDLTEPVVIVTKGRGYNPAKFDEDLATSRAKLGIEDRHQLHIGANAIKLVYFFHGINSERWGEMKATGVLSKIAAAKAEGLIDYIGFSSHYKDTVEIKEAIETDLFDVVELPYNIFNPSLAPLIELAHRHDLGIINMKAFGGNEMNQMFTMFREYVELDHEVMLQYCLANPYIATVDAGARYPAEFASDIKAALAPQPDAAAFAKYREQGAKLEENFNVKELCRDCRHCQEEFVCPQDLDFPSILLLHSRYRLAQAFGKDATEYRDEYRRMELQADRCIQCGQCVPECEYDLKIPELLARAAQEL